LPRWQSSVPPWRERGETRNHALNRRGSFFGVVQGTRLIASAGQAPPPKRRMTRAEFWQPQPKLVDTAVRTGISRALPKHVEGRQGAGIRAADGNMTARPGPAATRQSRRPETRRRRHPCPSASGVSGSETLNFEPSTVACSNLPARGDLLGRGIVTKSRTTLPS